MSRRTTHHREMLEHMLRSRSAQKKIGIEGMVWGAIEVPWWRNGQLYCETDLLIYTGLTYKKPYFVIEYKASEGHVIEAYRQLRRSEEFIHDQLQSECYKVFVYKFFDHEYIGPRPSRNRG
ncbi:MAG: hypothetical protein Q8O88_01065 [bacterium]|nr:hypothetical protein [bacterium]